MAKTLTGVNPSLVSGFHQLVDAVAERGGTIWLESGARSFEEQSSLYNDPNNPYPVAKPGTSTHEKGGALDIGGNEKSMKLARELAPQFGLVFPYADDPVHLELAGGSNAPVPEAEAPTASKPPMPLVDKFEAIARTIIGDIPQVIREVEPPGGNPMFPGAVTTPGDDEPVPQQQPESQPETPQQQDGPASGDFADVFNAAGQKYGIDPRLLSAVARAESGYNPQARSPAGAIGLMQFMPGTAAGLGIDPLDPVQAINGAARLLAGYIKQYGSTDLALAAYNAGPGAVQKYNGIPPYKETQNYVRRINEFLGGDNG